MNQYAQAALSGLIGFFVVFFVSLLTLVVSPVWGAVFWSIPFSVLASIIIFYATREKPSVSYKLLLSACATMLALVALLLTWGLLIKTWSTDDNPDANDASRRKAYWASFGIALVPWLVINAVFVTLVYTVPSVKSALF